VISFFTASLPSQLNAILVSRTMEADPGKELYRRVWKHIELEEFDQAEDALRQLIDTTDPGDSTRLWELNGMLAGVLNSLSRPTEGTEIYRRALAEARRAGESHATVGPARYMLASQLLLFGDPRDALAEADPVPPGTGHVQCLLHSVSAQALWKLGRRDEALRAARRAMDTAPTAERRADMTRDLDHIVSAG
jgi:tetratricopeptide (TPR) repeat protein